MGDEIDLGIDNLSEVEVFGRGGFSTVYGASHTLLKRRVAVKVLNRLTRESERRRFERECEVLGRLSDHPNVVTVHQAGYTTDGSPYLIMELVEGGTLADLLDRRGRLPWPEAIDLLLPVGSALARAHDESILHRDVKPENILLAGDEPRLADFGIAYLRDATGATSTHITASWLHTPPETFDNRRDERSDLYSLASTLYTLIVGHAPFWRPDDESLNPLMSRLLHEPAPAVAPDLAPAALNGFILRGLAKDPAERPQTVAAFVEELRGIRAGGSAPPPAPEPLPPSAQPTVAAPATYVPPTQAPPVEAPAAWPDAWAPPVGDPVPVPAGVPAGVATEAPKAGVGLRLLVSLGAFLVSVGLLLEILDFELFEFLSAALIARDALAMVALGTLAPLALLPWRRRSLGGLALGLATAALAFDVAIRLRFIGGAPPLVQAGRLAATLGCVLLMIMGLVLMERARSVKAGEVIVVVLSTAALLIGTVLAFALGFGPRELAVMAGVGMCILAGASLLSAGGSVPVAGAAYGLAAVAIRIWIWVSFDGDLGVIGGLGFLALGFSGLGFYGLTQIGRDQGATTIMNNRENGRIVTPSPSAG